MSFHKFFQIIDKSFIGRFIERKTAILNELDPKRIYVENIRRLFNIPYRLAKLLCEMAVKQNLYKKKVGVFCPSCDRMVFEVDKKEQIPDTIHCDICELQEKERYDFNKSEVQTMDFYQLNK